MACALWMCVKELRIANKAEGEKCSSEMDGASGFGLAFAKLPQTAHHRIRTRASSRVDTAAVVYSMIIECSSLIHLTQTNPGHPSSRSHRSSPELPPRAEGERKLTPRLLRMPCNRERSVFLLQELYVLF